MGSADEIEGGTGLDERPGCAVEDMPWVTDAMKGGGVSSCLAGNNCTAVTGLFGSTAAPLLNVAGRNVKNKADEQAIIKIPTHRRILIAVTIACHSDILKQLHVTCQALPD